MRNLLDNPVLLKELRIGLREKRMFIIQSAYILFLAVVAIIFLVDQLGSRSAAELPSVGSSYLSLLFWMQLVMLLLVTPSLTCGSVTAERERHSFDMMLASRLATWEIAAGKLGFALGVVGIILFSTLPLTAMVFFLGGVSPGEFGRCYLELAIAATLAAQLGLVLSARERRTAYATSQTYGITLGVLMFFLPFYGVIRDIEPVDEPVVWILLSYTVIYAGLFLHLKTLNHLRPKAVYLKALCWSFLLYYLPSLALTLNALMEEVEDLGNDGGFLWSMYLLVHLALLGLFLNDSGLEARLERERFQKSLFAKPMFWMALFSLGAAALVVIPAPDTDSMAGVSAFYSAICIMVAGLVSRSVYELLGRRVRFPVIFFSLGALVWFLPTLGLIGLEGNQIPGQFSMTYLSPPIALACTWEPGYGNEAVFPVGAVAVMLASAVIFPLLALGKRKRP